MSNDPDAAHDAYLVALREESERLLTTLDGVDPDAPVPTREGWTAADLLRHVGEVQQRWARIAEGHDGDDVPEPVELPELPEPAGPPLPIGTRRPADGDLVASVAVAGTALLAALHARPPGTPAWSWHPDGGTLAWIARRQAHEALIHRVDAELTAGVPVGPPVHDLAADGVDEVLRTFVHGVPDWATFTPDGTRVLLETTNDPERSWHLDLGRCLGTAPETGTAHDLDAAMLTSPDDTTDTAEATDTTEATDATAGSDGTEPPDLVIRGSAWDLDLWLWGRGPLEALTLDGDLEPAARLRALVVTATD